MELKDWEFAQVGKHDWESVNIPTSVHVELLKLGRIPDPFKGLDEWAVQWVGEADWIFKTSFKVSVEQLKHTHVALVFEGLDTYCDVTLNGKIILHASNMFVSHSVDCRDTLKVGTNELELLFRSSWHEAKKLEAEHGGPRERWNGDSSRLYSRKAQYGWGWDWGPILMTVGPWKPIRLEVADYTLEVDTKPLAGEKISLSSTCTIQPSPVDAELITVFRTKKGDILDEHRVPATQVVHTGFDVSKASLWWPVGYGDQPVYEVEHRLERKGVTLAVHKRTVAFRDAQIIQEPLDNAPGMSFLFQINGVRIFAGGSNWIPADSFLTTVDEGRYRRWLELMVRGNQNMVRVWAGGIYEPEVFYDLCDELGLLVWQDFMFGCGNYPTYPALLESVKEEAKQVVARLSAHPSVVIFAGNNEDYQLAESEGIVDYKDESGDYLKTAFPARHIYEVLLPEIVQPSGIFYHRGSPYGGVDSRDSTIGDIHQWNVWHGTQEPWANWDKLGGRFVSEFGMQGYPDIRTVDAWQKEPNQRYPQSRVSVNHNKADGFERRIELYLTENFRHSFDMESYVYFTQLMQAECLSAAYRLWRRNWKGRGKEYTAGALVWQINDCWPCVSWAIADYYSRPKPAFFAIARELATYSVGMARKEVSVPQGKSATCTITEQVELWVCNSTLAEAPGVVDLLAWDLEDGKISNESYNVRLAPNASTEVWSGTIPGQPEREASVLPRSIVLGAKLRIKDKVVARTSSWPEPYKYLAFPKPKLSIAVNGEEVRLSADVPVKGIILDVDGPAVEWSDQAIDLMPGDEVSVHAKGLGGREIKARFLE